MHEEEEEEEGEGERETVVRRKWVRGEEEEEEESDEARWTEGEIAEGWRGIERAVGGVEGRFVMDVWEAPQNQTTSQIRQSCRF